MCICVNCCRPVPRAQPSRVIAPRVVGVGLLFHSVLIEAYAIASHSTFKRNDEAWGPHESRVQKEESYARHREW